MTRDCKGIHMDAVLNSVYRCAGRQLDISIKSEPNLIHTTHCCQKAFFSRSNCNMSVDWMYAEFSSAT